jgi:FKBP-type peptidyl-prolyl cis-trans isomerase SlyD
MLKYRKFKKILTAAVLVAFAYSGHAQQQEGDDVIADGKTVGFEYSLTLEDGTVIENNLDSNQPIEYQQGGGQLLPALESALAGMRTNETKSVTLEPADAYGEVDPEAFQEIPRESLPEELQVVGTQLQAPGYEGPIRVHEIRDETVVLDFNHPLAGQPLTFDVRIVSVN